MFNATPDFFAGTWTIAPAPKAAKASKPAPKAKAKPAALTAYVPGPTVSKARKGTWRGYMIATTLKAGDTVAATKLHKQRARKAGFAPTAKLDFKWMLAQGYIAPAK